MRKELNDFQEFVRLVKARLERATTVAEVKTIHDRIKARIILAVRAGLSDSSEFDWMRRADSLCRVRLGELLKKELGDIFD